MADFIIHTDGGARGNPGPAGAGVVVADGKGMVLKRLSKFLGTQTNNWAEYEALIYALQELKKIVPENNRAKTVVEIKMDSELVVRQLNGEYQVKDEPLQLQYMKVHNIQVKDFPWLSFTHVPREENAGADELANKAMDGAGNQ